MSGENQVEIDAGALERELQSVELPADPLAAPAAADGEGMPAAPADTLESIQARAPHWKGGADFLVNFLCDGIAPAWGVPAEQREKLAQDGALALAAWFPDDAIPLRYLVLLNVGASAWTIVTSARDRHEGKLPPLRVAARAGAPATASTHSAGGGGAVTTSG